MLSQFALFVILIASAIILGVESSRMNWWTFLFGLSMILASTFMIVAGSGAIIAGAS